MNLKRFPTWLIITLMSSICLSLTACDDGSNFAPVTDIAAIEPIPQHGVHRTKQGETLYAIAWRYGLDYRVLAARNHINAPYHIQTGENIYLRAGEVIKSAEITKPYVPNVIKSQPNIHVTHLQNASLESISVKKPLHVATTHSVKFYPTPRVIGKWQWPAQGNVISAFSSLHKGINIAASSGTPVVAAAAGEVVYSGDGLRGYGNLIILKHNSLYLSAYAHTRKVFVKEGEWVKQGQKIAEIGNTGTDKTMLHFEIRRAGKPINPLSLYTGRL